MEGRCAARVQKVQKVLRVQRVVVSPYRAMNMKSALRANLPDPIVILTPGENLGACR